MTNGAATAAIEQYLAEAAATEIPGAEICLKLARAYKKAGDCAQAFRWALAVVDAGDGFTAWRSASAIARSCASGGAPPLRSAKLALVGSYTTGPLVDALWLAARRLGIALEIHEGQYGQYRQEIIDRESAMYAFAPDLVLLCAHHGELALPPHSADPEASVAAEVERWTALWNTVAANGGAGVIQHNFALPYEQPLGNLGAALPGSRYAMTHAVNARLGAAAQGTGGAVSIVDCERLSALHGKQRWFDPRYWNLAKQLVALDAVPLLARHTAAVIAGRLGLSRKCLVLDLDNTVWGGIIGEDGLGGIRLAGPDGEAFVAFQEYVLELKRKGVILAVASKNNPADAREPFEKHPEMRLRLDDIAAFFASWEPKSGSIRAIAEQLNIGLDAIAFADDNPAERQIIRQLLPEVDVIPLPADPALYTRALADYLGFETSAFTAEDAKRTDQYRARAQIAELASSTQSIEDFYRGLQMRAIVAPFDDMQLPRIAQLIGKTNQFNLTTRRHGLVELRAMAGDPRCVHLSLRLRDRFADHGIVGVIIAMGEGDTLEIDTWLMSCRVLGRTADAEMLAHLSRRAQGLGYAAIGGTYVPTAKNALVQNLFAKFGFDLIDERDGTTRWRYDLRAKGPIQNEFIEAVDVWEGVHDATSAA